MDCDQDSVSLCLWSCPHHPKSGSEVCRLQNVRSLRALLRWLHGRAKQRYFEGGKQGPTKNDAWTCGQTPRRTPHTHLETSSALYGRLHLAQVCPIRKQLSLFRAVIAVMDHLMIRLTTTSHCPRDSTSVPHLTTLSPRSSGAAETSSNAIHGNLERSRQSGSLVDTLLFTGYEPDALCRTTLHQSYPLLHAKQHSNAAG